MKHPLEQLLDGCIAELNRGADLEGVLSAHPEVADELRPLLATAITTQMAVPPPVRKAERKDAFLAQVAAHRRQVETVEGYVVELRAGVPVAELMERAPEALQPLVHAAWRMHTTPAPAPEASRREADKATLLALVARRRAERVRAAAPSWLARTRLEIVERLSDGTMSRGRRRAWSGALGSALAVLVLFVGVSGVGSASASSLPGEPFYHVKRLGESAQLFFAFEPARRAELNLQFTERRLREIQRLSERSREVPLDVVEDWLRLQSDAWADIQALPAAQREALMRELAGLMGDGQALEARLHAAVADQAALDALLEQSAGLARTLVPTPEPEHSLVPEPLVHPMPVQPAEEPEKRAEPPARAASPEQPPVLAPALAVPVEPASAAPVEPPVVAPPAEDPEDERGHERPANPGNPGQPVAEPTVSPAPPPIVGPPLEDPNSPSPGDPGGGNPNTP